MRIDLTPQLRGRIPPGALPWFAAAGYRVHRVGAAVYVHGPDGHFLFGAWARRDEPPPWADRLGELSAGYRRRAERLEREQRARRFARDVRGRFLARLPWYRVPPVQVYSFEPAGLSLVDREELRAAERRAELRKRGYWA